jgi:hypothetical protein
MVTDEGIVIVERAVILANANRPIRESRDGSPNTTGNKRGHPENTLSRIVSTLHGISIDVSELQPPNEWPPIDERLDPDSNVTLDRAWQASKHLGAIVTTVAGRHIVNNDPQTANTQCSIAQTSDGLSNVTLVRPRQPAKQFAQSRSIERGIQTDSNESHSKNA